MNLSNGLWLPSQRIAAVGGFGPTPTFVDMSTNSGGVNDVPKTPPGSLQANDILLMFIESANQPGAMGDGYALITSVGIGTPGDVAATSLEVFWKRTNGTEGTVIIPDRGDHTYANIMAVRGCPPSGDPWHAFDELADSKNPGLPFFSPHLPSERGNLFVVAAFAHPIDLGAGQFSGPLNYHELGALTQRANAGTTQGNGGGIGLFTGEQAAIGASRVSVEITPDGTNVASVIIALKG